MVIDDIVTRLRESSGMTTSRSDDGFLSIHPDTDLMRQAADEIERLRQLTGRLATLLMPFGLLMTKDEQEMVLKAVRGE